MTSPAPPPSRGAALAPPSRVGASARLADGLLAPVHLSFPKQTAGGASRPGAAAAATELRALLPGAVDGVDGGGPVPVDAVKLLDAHPALGEALLYSPRRFNRLLTDALGRPAVALLAAPAPHGLAEAMALLRDREREAVVLAAAAAADGGGEHDAVAVAAAGTLVKLSPVQQATAATAWVCAEPGCPGARLENAVDRHRGVDWGFDGPDRGPSSCLYCGTRPTEHLPARQMQPYAEAILLTGRGRRVG